MIPNYTNREVDTSPITDVAAFGISFEHSAHIMSILRDTLYSDKVLAVLREYSANAWDSHRMSGKADVPIKVVLPTLKDPTLTIQDFGDGLSHDDVFIIYTQYGASTKRNNNDAVGQMGIGSKCGFSYSDSFTITSHYGGKKRIYVAVLDSTDKGVINLLYEEDCGEETGLTIQIPVKPTDIEEFHEKAQELFQYFVPRPDINANLPPAPLGATQLTHGLVFQKDDTHRGWTAVMGCIPYKVDLEHVHRQAEEDTNDEGVGGWIRKLSGILYFGIGELQVSASRESLKYSTDTKKALVQKLNDVVDDYVKQAFREINSNAISGWDKRLRAQVLAYLELPIPDNLDHLAKTNVQIQTPDIKLAAAYNLDEDGEEIKPSKVRSKRDEHRNIVPKGFFIGFRGKADTAHSVSSIRVLRSTQLLLANDARRIDGFRLTGETYMVYPLDDTPWDQVRKNLDEYLLQIECDGVPIGDLSAMSWTAPYVPPKVIKTVNKKHQRKVFVLVDKPRFSSPYSKCWDLTTNPVTASDVFVLLEHFRPCGQNKEFSDLYRRDRRMVESLGATMPKIYGYKTTEKKPLTEDKCLGISYVKWRETLSEQLAKDPIIGQMIYTHQWKSLFPHHRFDEELWKAVFELLGDNHPVVLMVSYSRDALKYWDTIPMDKKEAVARLSNAIHEFENPSTPVIAMRELFKRYPLLKVEDEGLSVLWGRYSRSYAEYITLVDKAYEAGLITKQTPVEGEEGTDFHDDEL